jgi:hypothetical protein
MQNALQNPHYKKIWEKVMINRHPLCERKDNTKEAMLLSLAGALKQEMRIVGCYYYVGDSLNMVSISIPTAKSIQYDKENGLRGVETLGRPITLFDVLALLNKDKTLEETQYVSNGSKIFKVCFGDNYNEFFCDFTTNLLHEQTPETWEKISNLI